MTTNSDIFFCLSEWWKVKGFLNKRSGFEVTDICVAGGQVMWYNFPVCFHNANHDVKWNFKSTGFVA